MFSIPKLIVLMVICETTVCQTENSALTARYQRQSRSQNASHWRNSNPNKQTNKQEEDEIIRNVFSVSDSGLVLFNTTHNTNERVVDTSELQQDQSLNEKQEFKVQRNPDGKLNIVFNDVFFSQKSVPQRSTATVEQYTTPYIPNQYSQKDIYFPDEIDIDPRCKQEGKSFCTDVQNYPADKLENILKNQLSKFDVLFGDDDIPQPLNISQRMSPGEDSLCSSVERVIYPKAGESKDLKWLYIVNHQNYTQAVKIEECVNPEAPCMFAESFPNRYITKCKQNYIYRQLVAFTKTGEIVKDVFKLPSCCKCIYKQV